jgi:hypothetical protein
MPSKHEQGFSGRLKVIVDTLFRSNLSDLHHRTNFVRLSLCAKRLREVEVNPGKFQGISGNLREFRGNPGEKQSNLGTASSSTG